MPTSSEVFHGVSIGLYTDDGTMLCSKPIGDLGVTEGQLNVSLSWQGRPRYVTIESPGFWTLT
jgi:hypothetical protein